MFLREGGVPPGGWRWVTEALTGSGRCRPARRDCQCVARRAGELAFEGGEGVEDGAGLKGSVSSSYVDLSDDAGGLETVHGFVGGLEAAADELSGAGH